MVILHLFWTLDSGWIMHLVHLVPALPALHSDLNLYFFLFHFHFSTIFGKTHLSSFFLHHSVLRQISVSASENSKYSLPKLWMKSEKYFSFDIFRKFAQSWNESLLQAICIIFWNICYKLGWRVKACCKLFVEYSILLFNIIVRISAKSWDEESKPAASYF